MPDINSKMSKTEMAVSKLFSAQWLMAVLVTVAASAIAIWSIIRHSSYTDTILAVYFTNWGIIIANYFKRDKTQDGSSVSTETKVTETKNP